MAVPFPAERALVDTASQLPQSRCVLRPFFIPKVFIASGVRRILHAGLIRLWDSWPWGPPSLNVQVRLVPDAPNISLITTQNGGSRQCRARHNILRLLCRAPRHHR
jgi:hypothetical protein